MAVRDPSSVRSTVLGELSETLAAGRQRVVSGERGAGRSRLLTRLVERLEAEHDVHLLIATRSTASIPFGIFLPFARRAAPAVELAAQLRIDLLGSRPFLIVDDAHLVDEPSAALLLDLAREGMPIALSVRASRSLPDAIVELERRCGVPRITLPPLTEAEVARIVQQERAAVPDPALLSALVRRSGGVPLHVRGMLSLLDRQGRIVVRSGVAFLLSAQAARAGAGGAAPSGLVAGADADGETGRVDGSDGGSDAEAVRVAQLVALAGELSGALVARLFGADALEHAEADDLVSVRPTDGGASVVPRHPFIGDSLVGSMRPATRFALLSQLADAPPPVEADPLRTAQRVRWRIELGREVDDDELMSAIGGIPSSGSAEADDLLDAALARRMPAPARLRLAALLAHRQRLDDAEAVVSGLRDEPLPSALARERDLARAFMLMLPANEPARAEIMLGGLEAQDASGRAHRATARMQLGDIGYAARLAGEVFSDRSAPAPARAHAALTLSASLLYAGRGSEYERVRRERKTVIDESRSEIPEASESATLIDEALLLEHREALGAARALAQASHDRALDRGDDAMRAPHSHVLARIALERGMPRRAVVFATAAALSTGLWAMSFRARISATHVEALVLAGHLEEAQDAIARAAQQTRSPLYDVDVARARAVADAADGDVAAAGDALAGVAVAALAREQVTRGRYALEQAVRYRSGAAARALLRMAAGEAATERARRLARAWLDADPAKLDASARELDDRGMLWRAVEVAALAASLRSDSRGLFDTLRRRCIGLHSPVVARAGWSELTAREQEIVLAAIAGRTDADIANAAGVSVRTVQTHLVHVYRKLGVSRRGDLASVLPEARGSYVVDAVRSPGNPAGDSHPISHEQREQ